MGIDDFIESFVRDGCANKKLKSVCVVWNDRDNQQSPAPKHLRKPAKVDMMPLPNDKAWWFGPAIHRVSPCAMHSFVNTHQWKRMETYMWTLEFGRWDGRRTAHVLLCHVTNL